MMGFAWNAWYADQRLENILAIDLEGKELALEGGVAALPQGNSAGAKFAFEIDSASSGRELINSFPKKSYLSWQPAWRNPQEIPEVIPGQRWKFKAKLKRPYGSLNPYTFDFERWSFHQDHGEFSASVLDIGQGTAVLIETVNRRLLYDTGPI